MRFYDIGESPLMGHSEKCIAPLVLGGIIAAGASLAGNAIGASSQNKTNQTNIDINRENNAFNAQQAQIQRDWQEKMWGVCSLCRCAVVILQGSTTNTHPAILIALIITRIQSIHRGRGIIKSGGISFRQCGKVL